MSPCDKSVRDLYGKRFPPMSTIMRQMIGANRIKGNLNNCF